MKKLKKWIRNEIMKADLCPENKANANLIAAAPELLEALKNLLNNMSPATLTHDNTLKEAIINAELAIKKALENY